MVISYVFDYDVPLGWLSSGSDAMQDLSVDIKNPVSGARILACFSLIAGKSGPQGRAGSLMDVAQINKR